MKRLKCWSVNDIVIPSEVEESRRSACGRAAGSAQDDHVKRSPKFPDCVEAFLSAG